MPALISVVTEDELRSLARQFCWGSSKFDALLALPDEFIFGVTLLGHVRRPSRA